jgi:hypothetical protein
MTIVLVVLTIGATARDLALEGEDAIDQARDRCSPELNDAHVGQAVCQVPRKLAPAGDIEALEGVQDGVYVSHSLPPVLYRGRHGSELLGRVQADLYQVPQHLDGQTAGRNLGRDVGGNGESPQPVIAHDDAGQPRVAEKPPGRGLDEVWDSKAPLHLHTNRSHEVSNLLAPAAAPYRLAVQGFAGHDLPRVSKALVLDERRPRTLSPCRSFLPFRSSSCTRSAAPRWLARIASPARVRLSDSEPADS